MEDDDEYVDQLTSSFHIKNEINDTISSKNENKLVNNNKNCSNNKKVGIENTPNSSNILTYSYYNSSDSKVHFMNSGKFAKHLVSLM